MDSELRAKIRKRILDPEDESLRNEVDSLLLRSVIGFKTGLNQLAAKEQMSQRTAYKISQVIVESLFEEIFIDPMPAINRREGGWQAFSRVSPPRHIIRRKDWGQIWSEVDFDQDSKLLLPFRHTSDDNVQTNIVQEGIVHAHYTTEFKAIHVLLSPNFSDQEAKEFFSNIFLSLRIQRSTQKLFKLFHEYLSAHHRIVRTRSIDCGAGEFVDLRLCFREGYSPPKPGHVCFGIEYAIDEPIG